MKKLVKIEKLTNNKWLNLFVAKYVTESGGNYNYFFASRRSLEDLSARKREKVDAVRILPYLKENGKTYVVLIKEFRHAINDYIYSTPAGLIDEGENSTQAAVRELGEEIGASVVKIQRVLNPGYSSAGLTDECIECFEAEVKLDKKQKLDASEDISYFKIEVEKLPEFIKKNKFGLQSALMLRCFYFENELFKHIEEENE